MLEKIMKGDVRFAVVYIITQTQGEQIGAVAVMVVIVDGFPNPLDRPVEVSFSFGIHDDDELVAAIAGDKIFFAQALPQKLGGFFQQMVSGRVSKAVVNVFEIVDINHDGGETVSGSDFVFQMIVQLAPVVEAGQVIGVKFRMLGKHENDQQG